MKLSDLKKSLPSESSLNGFSSQIENLKLVLAMVKKINSNISSRDVLKTIIQSAMELSGCSRGAILIKWNSELEFKVGLNKFNDTISETEFNISYSVCDDVIASGKSMFLEKAQGTEGFSPSTSIIALNLQTIICAPLTFDGKVIGVLYVDSNNMSLKDISSINSYFDMFAEHAALAIYNSNKIIKND